MTAYYKKYGAKARSYRSSKRKSYKKYPTKWAAARYTRTSRVPYAIAPKKDLSIVSPTHNATLVYADRHYTNTAVGAYYEADIGANCLYDPFLSLGGHQPRGFQELIQLYRKGYVKSCSARVLFELATANVASVVGCWFENTGTSSTYNTPADIMECARTHGGQWALISNQHNRVGQITLDVSCLCAKLLELVLKMIPLGILLLITLNLKFI